MRMLITGASGLLGTKLTELSLRGGYDTYACYNSHPVKQGTPIRLDITRKNEVEEVFRSVKPDVVVHCAALTNVDLCEREPELARKVNVEGTRNLLEAAEQLDSFVVYVSTDYVFSGERGDYRETDETNPVNVYGWSKLEGERLIIDSSIESCVVRPSVIYGSVPATGKTNFVLWVIEQLKESKEINIINDQWVSPTLNTNLSEMILEVVEKRLTGIIHTAGVTQINRYDFTERIAKTFKLNQGLIKPVTSEAMNWIAKRPQNSTLNVEKALRTLENKPWSLDFALKKLKEELSYNR